MPIKHCRRKAIQGLGRAGALLQALLGTDTLLPDMLACALARDPKQSPAIQSLEQVLSSEDADAATEAAGAFWSLCVENTVSPPNISQEGG
jgi:hypothetical protein